VIPFKVYNATGISPDGRLFAGDLNLFQALVAALDDLTQNLRVGSVAIGESGLAISRFGSLEASLSGALRTSGIIRALGGFVPPTFTTTARDAIPNGAGQKPYGMIIVNTTLNRLEMNYGTDSVADWRGVGASQVIFNTQTTDYTPVFSDIDKWITITSSTAKNLTVPTNASVPFPIGISFQVQRGGTGTLTIVPAGGVTVHNGIGYKLAGQWSVATLVKSGTDAWELIGDVSA
jgi:hypothetical protein